MYFNNVYLFCIVCIFYWRVLWSSGWKYEIIISIMRNKRNSSSGSNSIAIQWWEISVQERTKASIYTALWTIILNVKSALNFQILLSYLFPSKTSCHQLNDFSEARFHRHYLPIMYLLNSSQFTYTQHTLETMWSSQASICIFELLCSSPTSFATGCKLQNSIFGSILGQILFVLVWSPEDMHYQPIKQNVFKNYQDYVIFPPKSQLLKLVMIIIISSSYI